MDGIPPVILVHLRFVARSIRCHPMISFVSCLDEYLAAYGDNRDRDRGKSAYPINKGGLSYKISKSILKTLGAAVDMAFSIRYNTLSV